MSTYVYKDINTWELIILLMDTSLSLSVLFSCLYICVNGYGHRKVFIYKTGFLYIYTYVRTWILAASYTYTYT